MSAPLPEQINRIRAIDELKAQGFANDVAVRLVMCKETHAMRLQHRQQAVHLNDYRRPHDAPQWAMACAAAILIAGAGAVLGLVFAVADAVKPHAAALIAKVWGS